MNPQRILRVAALVAAIAVYISARFWNIGASCLWFDEIFSVHAAEHSWNTILNFVSLDLIHPPLFYLLLKLWIAIGGESLIWLRSLPVLFSILGIIPFLFLCRELRLGQWVTILALFLIAVNGSLIKYAQEVRMYSMLLCLALFSIWLFTRYFRSGRGIAFLAIANVLLVYTHYYGWFVVITEVLAISLYRRAKMRRIFSMLIAVAISFLPWLIGVLSAANSGSDFGQNIGWMQRPGPIEIGQLILNLVEPFYYSAMSIDLISIYRVSIPLLLIAIVSLVIYFAKYGIADDEQRTSSVLLALFVAVPLALALLASWLLPYSIWGTRHLIIVFPPMAILIAIAIVSLRHFKVRIFLVSMLLLFNGYAFLLQADRTQTEAIWCGFEPLGREIQAETNVPILVFEDLAAYHLWFVFRHDVQQPQIIKVRDFPEMPEDKAYFLPRGFDEVNRVQPDNLGSPEIWVVYRSTIYDSFSPPLYGMQEQGYEIADHKTIDFGYQKLIGVLLRRKNH